MSEEEVAGEAAAPAKSSNKILPIMLVVNTLLLTGVLIFVMKRPSAQAAGGKEHAKAEESEKSEKKEGGEEKKKEEKSEHSEKSEGGGHGEGGEGAMLVKLESFIVQIRAVEGDRYAHLTIEIEVGGEGDKKAIESRTSRIRDAVIGYLADRSEDELRGSEGLTMLKEAFTKKIDEIVPGKRVQALFITEFIIQ